MSWQTELLYTCARGKYEMFCEISPDGGRIEGEDQQHSEESSGFFRVGADGGGAPQRFALPFEGRYSLTQRHVLLFQLLILLVHVWEHAFQRCDVFLLLFTREAGRFAVLNHALLALQRFHLTTANKLKKEKTTFKIIYRFSETRSQPSISTCSPTSIFAIKMQSLWSTS